MRIFGEGGLIDFSTKTVDQYNRYQDLGEQTRAFEDDPNSPGEGPEYDQWHAHMSEQVDLYYELEGKVEVVEVEEESRPWWRPW